jgi:hypothetical protein
LRIREHRLPRCLHNLALSKASKSQLFPPGAAGDRHAGNATRIRPAGPRERGVRLGGWLSVIAYNLGNLWRRLVLPQRISNWSLTSLQQRLVETSGRLLKHARHYWLLLAESHLTRRLFGAMLRRIELLPLPTG